VTTALAPNLPSVDGPLQTYELGDEHKRLFLELIREGYDPAVAAHEAGSSATRFRRLRHPGGAHYDPDFAQAYEEAMRSPDRERNRLELVRELVWEAARAGNTRIIEKLALIYDPDWEPLRHANLRVDVRILARMLPGLSDEELERAIRAQEEQQALEPGPLRLVEDDR